MYIKTLQNIIEGVAKEELKPWIIDKAYGYFTFIICR